MASIRQRDGKFQVRIIRKGHRALSKTFTNRGDAVKWARATEVEIERGAIQSHTRSITLADAISRYREERTPHKKGARSERYLLDAWARSPLSSTPLNRIRPAQIAEWRDARGTSGAAAQTVRNHLTALSSVFQAAITEWGHDELTNPVRRIRRPPPPRARTRRVTPEEIETIKANTESKDLPDLIDLCVETAMRLGEAVSLTIGSVDLKTRTLTLADTKNGHSRVVPLSTRAIVILGLRITSAAEQDRRLFPITAHAATVAFRRAVTRARRAHRVKLSTPPQETFLNDLRFHDLRREATSRLFERGLSVMEVSSVTGHRVLEMLRRYTSLQIKNIATKLDTENRLSTNST
ncbi:MAG: site-specific integrase [Gammaproteobacteria bacterium]|nr:site-specific integrase [Gammaproteobacteria bacterium]